MLSVNECRKAINALSQHRRTHSENVAKAAKKIAARYNADEDKAYIVGLIHDVTKEYSIDEHMKIFDKFDIKLDFVQKNTPKLWHALSGAEFVRNILGEKDKEIYNAIKYHTTGRDNMSLLEKIIFVADFVSEERDYEGVDRIRGVLEHDGLDVCVLEGFAFSIEDLTQNRKFVHKDTVLGYNYILDSLKKREN